MSLKLHPLPQAWHCQQSTWASSSPLLLTAWHNSLFTTAASDTIWAYSNDERHSYRHHQRCAHAVSPAQQQKPLPDTGIQYTEGDALERLVTECGLDLRICKYGANCYGRFKRCPLLHTLADILAVFKQERILGLYRDAPIQDSEEARPLRWELRDTTDFVCHTTKQCTEAQQCTYALRLKHDTNNLLKYPTCRVFCTHCRKTRTLPVYV